MAQELPITNGFYTSTILPISHQRCSNCFPSIPSVPALSAEQLFWTPGSLELTSTGSIQQKNRGSHVKNGIAYFVNGSSLYRVNLIQTVVLGITIDSFDTTELGTIEGTGRVSMADNGTQLLVLNPGGKGYIYNEDDGTPFQEITDSDFTANGNPQHVVFIDSYFILSTDTKKFIISAINDGLTYSALDFATAESDPDAIVAPIVINNMVLMTGSETTEGFQNVPSVGRVPFIRNNLILDKGCFAPFSLVKTNSTFFMVGGGTNESPAIWQFIGNNFQKVSNEAIDQLLASYTDTQISEIFALTYADSGNYFVTFTLPDTTLCYEIITKRWHERNSLVTIAPTEQQESRWRVNSLVTAYGKVLVGDVVDGRIGHLSGEYITEYENHIIRLFTTQPFTNEGDEIVAKMIELTMESGMGNIDCEDPVASLAISSNGKTFGPERTRRIGKKGEYSHRTVWYRNGSCARFAVLQFRMSEPIRSAFIKLEYE